MPARWWSGRSPLAIAQPQRRRRGVPPPGGRALGRRQLGQASIVTEQGTVTATRRLRRPVAAAGAAGLRATRSRRPTRSCFFVHRTLPDADLYFVNNRNDRDEDSGSDVPRERTRSRDLARRHRGSASRRRIALRAIARRCRCISIRGTRCSSCSGSQRPRRRERLPPRPIAAHRDIDGPWTVRFQARPRRARDDHAGHAAVLERQRRSGREVLLGHRGVTRKTVDAPADVVRTGRADCGLIWAT